MVYLFRSKDKDGKPNGNWRFQYTDWKGRRRTGTGTNSKTETKEMAEDYQAVQTAIRKGYRPPPKSSRTHSVRPFEDVAAEYQAWGESKGGRRGRPWGKDHARKRRFHLEWWQQRLGLETLGDLDGILPHVEAALRELQSSGKAPKTLQNYSEALAALCDWCHSRGYLDDDPLEGFAPFDTTPRSKRRLMTDHEIEALLEAAKDDDRRLVYETAICTGLRAGELRALKVRHLDALRSGLRLEAAWTKNRKAGFQPMPKALAVKLAAVSHGKHPGDPLLNVPLHPSRAMGFDMVRADIKKHLPGGKLDFHALRNVYINRVIESGATTKEAQALARHSSPELTMNTYGRTRPERLTELSEAAGKGVLPMESTKSAQRKAAGAEADCVMIGTGSGNGHSDSASHGGSSPPFGTIHTLKRQESQPRTPGVSSSKHPRRPRLDTRPARNRAALFAGLRSPEDVGFSKTLSQRWHS